jgi:ribonuclease VapC
MIVDSSAIIAVLLDEPERAIFQPALESSASAKMAAPTFLKASMVLASRRGPEILTLLDGLRLEIGITILPFTEGHSLIARAAFLRYGKGRHAAGLNFGDCISYAVSKVEGEPLLFKGDDFSLTDVEPAVAPR